MATTIKKIILPQDAGLDKMQLITVTEGCVNLDSDDDPIYEANAIHCVEDGSVIFNYTTGNSDTVAMVAGDDLGVGADVVSLTLSTGKYIIN